MNRERVAIEIGPSGRISSSGASAASRRAPISLLDWSALTTDIGLYTPKRAGQTDGYLGEDGPFANARCERLGAVAVFNVHMPSAGIVYRCRLFENPHALASVVLPPYVLADYDRHRGGNTAPARPAGEPWFAEILRDPEWQRDPWAKARKIALDTIEEFRSRRRNTDA